MKSPNIMDMSLMMFDQNYNKSIKKNKNLCKLALLLSDCTVWLISFLIGLCALILYSDISTEMLGKWWLEKGKLQLAVYLSFAAIAIAIFWKDAHYHDRTPFWEDAGDALRVIIILALLNGSFFVLSGRDSSRTVWLVSFTSCAIVLPIMRTCCRSLLNRAGLWKIPTIMIGTGELALSSYAALTSESDLGYDVKAIIHTKEIKSDFNYPCQTILWPKDNAEQLAKLLKNFHIIYAVPPAAEKNYPNWLAIFSKYFFDLHVAPAISDLPFASMRAQHFFSHDILILKSRNNLLNKQAQLTKRAIDLVISTILVILLSPILIIISALIKYEGGSVIFKQNRRGKGNKVFHCLKFRTMHVDAESRFDDLLKNHSDLKQEWDQYRKLKNDPRITIVGNFLRKTSLDELPQLFNVIKGEMSLVGPRPRLIDEPSDFYYEAVNPGITGLWQVSGRNQLPYESRITLDIWYVRNWNIWYDTAILFKTIKVVLLREGAY